MAERYDIKYKWDTEMWIIVDTGNRYCPTGEEFYDRVLANERANELNGRPRRKRASR